MKNQYISAKVKESAYFLTNQYIGNPAHTYIFSKPLFLDVSHYFE